MSAFDRGLDHFRAARYEQARAELTAATEQEPANPQAWRYLAATYFTTGDFASAEAPARQCVALTPGDPAAHLNLGIVLRKLEMWDQAREVLSESLRLRPDYEAARVELGKLSIHGPPSASWIEEASQFEPFSE